MKKTFVYFLISLTACSVEQVVKDFPRSENIKMNETVVPEPFYDAGSMFTTDDYLVILQRRTLNNKYFRFYSLDSLHFVLEGGDIGLGPDELISAAQNYFIPEGNRFTLIDNFSFKLIDIEEGKFKVVKKDSVKTPMGMFPDNNYQKIDDNVFCITNMDFNRPYEFVLFDKDGENPLWVSPYPKWANLTREPPFSAYKGTVVPNPALQRFMVFYAKFRKVRLFDSKGNLLKDISVEFPFKFPPYEEGVYSRMLAYFIPYSDDQYIYAICGNEMPSPRTERKTSTELQIWNWNAEPVAVLYLDKWLREFTISKEKRRLYAIDPLNPDDEISGKIFWCDLPGWLYD